MTSRTSRPGFVVPAPASPGGGVVPCPWNQTWSSRAYKARAVSSGPQGICHPSFTTSRTKRWRACLKQTSANVPAARGRRGDALHATAAIGGLVWLQIVKEPVRRPLPRRYRKNKKPGGITAIRAFAPNGAASFTRHLHPDHDDADRPWSTAACSMASRRAQLSRTARARSPQQSAEARVGNKALTQTLVTRLQWAPTNVNAGAAC